MPRYDQIAVSWKSDKDILWVSLNDSFEYALSEILRRDEKISKAVLGWKRAMAEAVPGYNSYQEVRKYIQTNLASKALDCDFHQDITIGDEAYLLQQLKKVDTNVPLDKYQYGNVDFDETSLDLITTRKDIIGKFRDKTSAIPKDIKHIKEEKNKVNPLLLYKFYYTYKLWEVLEAAVGYYNGSLEFRVGAKDDFEYWSYLLQLKLRHPARNYPFKAPKSMRLYKTYPASLLPFNNQFSYSYGFDEFTAKDMPDAVRIFFQGALVKTVFDDDKWYRLVDLMEWNKYRHPSDNSIYLIRENIRAYYKSAITIDKKVADAIEALKGDDILKDPSDFINEVGNIKLVEVQIPVPTWENGIRVNDGKESIKPFEDGLRVKDFQYSLVLDNILKSLRTEIATKAFYTLVLGIQWSQEILPREHNVFAKIFDSVAYKDDDEYSGDLDRLMDDTTIKDLRLSNVNANSAIERLAAAKYTFNCVGRNANTLVTPETASMALRAKLYKLRDELPIIYDNIVAFDLLKEKDLTVDNLVKQAEKAAKSWIDQADKNKKPIYTGASGHAITYTRLYLQALLDNPSLIDDNEGLPDLYECMLVILASITGFNQHHSYDEAMTSLHGITFDFALDKKPKKQFAYEMELYQKRAKKLISISMQKKSAAIDNNGDDKKKQDGNETSLRKKGLQALCYTHPEGYIDLMDIPGHKEISNRLKAAARSIAQAEIMRLQKIDNASKNKKKPEKLTKQQINALASKKPFSKDNDAKKKPMASADDMASNENMDDIKNDILIKDEEEWNNRNAEWYEILVANWYENTTGEKFKSK